MKVKELRKVITTNATRFEIVCFRAVDHPDLCRKYVEGHINVLKDYGVTSVTSSNPTWTKNPNAYCIVAMRDDEMFGGIRIHKSDGINPLPMELGVSSIDPRVTYEIDKFIPTGCGEQCGLWNSKKTRGYGVSWILVNSSIAILPQLGIHKLFGLASDYSMFLFSPAGFEIQRKFGNNGDFNYPTEKYIARVVVIEDCYALPTSGKKEVNFVTQIRDDYYLKSDIVVNQLKLSLTFNLKIEND